MRVGLGIIEGFFGKSWSWEARLNYADFLRDNGFACYLYAPKSDSCFRRDWRQPCPAAHLEALCQLARRHRQAGLEFWLGLSPLDLHLDFSPAGQSALKSKMAEIAAIEPEVLCILFDDMPGGDRQLASHQARIMDFVSAHGTAQRLALCPTYYADEPILDRLFGARPPNYLQELGQALDPAIEVFWTGPKVISKEFPLRHLREVADKLRRKPLIWDNCLANDGERTATCLPLMPPKRRNPNLEGLVSGHLFNPMNQPCLSALPLYMLARIYRPQLPGGPSFAAACAALCGSELSALLRQDAPLFQEAGLKELSEQERATLKEKYAPCQEQPMAREILAWLDGDYAFDPACLT